LSGFIELRLYVHKNTQCLISTGYLTLQKGTTDIILLHIGIINENLLQDEHKFFYNSIL